MAETFPIQLEDTPAYINFPGENSIVNYGEGVFIGYRYYDTKKQPVQFPFGYGLSYTSFDYSNLQLSAHSITDQDDLTVTVDVTNTGSMVGKTVVQVYVHDHEAKVARPTKELKGFAKVALEPGETKTITVTLPPRAFQFYDTGYGVWRAETGAFDILIGDSAQDIRLTATVNLTETQILPCMLDVNSTIGDWLGDPRGKAIIEPLLDQIKGNLPSGGLERWYGTDLLPLRVVLGFFGQEMNLPKPADAFTDDLLAEIHAMATQ